MSQPNQVHSQITDANTQNSSSVLGVSPTVALSLFYQAAGQAYAITMQSAAANQQNLNALNTPVVTNAITAITAAGKPKS